MATTHVFIGTEKGAFLLQSDEVRSVWTLREPVLRGWKVGDIRVDTRAPEPTLWAAVGSFVYAACIHRSDDLGETWTQLDSAPEYEEDSPGKMNAVWSVVPGHDDTPGELFAGVADAGLFRSSDAGTTWDNLKGISEHPTRAEWQPGAGGLCCHTILLHPTNPQRIWVGISAVGVFRTDDAGETWQLRNKGLEIVLEAKENKEVGSCVHRIVLDPRNPDRLFQQNHRGLFRSFDGADTWERIENGLPTASCFGFPIAMDANDSDTLFIVPQESDEYRFARDGHLTVYRTKDAGESWHAAREGLPDAAFTGVLRQAMGTDSHDPCGVYFGTTGGEVYASNDAGDSWSLLPFRFPRVNSVTAWVED